MLQGRSFALAGSVIYSQRHHCGSPGACLRRRVAKINDVVGALQDRSDDLALNSNPLSMNNPQEFCAPATRFLDIILNNCANLRRRDRVQIDDVAEFDCYNIREWIVRVDCLVFVFISNRDCRSFAFQGA